MSNTRDDDVGRQNNVFQHQHQVTVAQRSHDAGQRSDLEQRSDMSAVCFNKSFFLHVFHYLTDN